MLPIDAPWNTTKGQADSTDEVSVSSKGLLRRKHDRGLSFAAIAEWLNRCVDRPKMPGAGRAGAWGMVRNETSSSRRNQLETIRVSPPTAVP
jgi:hypothetical protein